MAVLHRSTVFVICLLKFVAVSFPLSIKVRLRYQIVEIPGQIEITVYSYSVGRCVIPCAFFGKSVKHIFSCSKMYPD